MREHSRGQDDVHHHVANARLTPDISPARRAFGRHVTRVPFAALATLIVLTQAAVGCVSLHSPVSTAPASERAWPNVLTVARSRAADGKFDAADSLFADFALSYPGTSEALETAYWRGIFKLDPSNAHGSLTTGMASLDAYLADSRPRTHVAEATTIRRVGAQLDGLSRLAASAMAQAKDATNTASTAKAQVADANARAEAAKAEIPPTADSEIKRLKDELAKANAELDRIRKRLAQPPPKP